MAADPMHPDDERSASLYFAAGISAFVALAVCIAAIAAYHAAFFEKQRFGAVDIGGILELSELRFTEIISQPHMPEADRLKALDQVRQVGPRLDTAIAAVQQECHCILLAKAAVMGEGVIDYTDRIKAAVDLAGVDVVSTQARIRDAFRGAKPEVQKP